MSKFTVRTIAAQITYEVVYKKNNLNEVFVQRLSASTLIDLKSAIKALCFSTIRHYFFLEDMWLQHVQKRPKDKMIRAILTQAMAEFKHLDKPKHVVVNEAINTAKKLNKKWATGLINSCLRKAVELPKYVPTNIVAQYSHPQWWIDKIKQDWPQDWQQMLKENNKMPPLWVRSIKPLTMEISSKQHQEIKSAYKIPAQDITSIDAFNNGNLSVQDASAQLAAIILSPKDQEKILDACAAPGGKTGHLLELNSNIKLDALEIYSNRAKKIEENLKRLQLNANIVIADASKTDEWFKSPKYDKILIDAPCSASGIVRRHPDIRHLRKAEDLDNICRDQQNLLSSLATILATNGTMLYSTCSIFKQENSDQIKMFLKTHPEFSEIKLKYPFAVNCEYGIQILSGTDDMDGFYYCYLKKNEI